MTFAQVKNARNVVYPRRLWKPTHIANATIPYRALPDYTRHYRRSNSQSKNNEQDSTRLLKTLRTGSFVPEFVPLHLSSRLMRQTRRRRDNGRKSAEPPCPRPQERGTNHEEEQLDSRRPAGYPVPAGPRRRQGHADAEITAPAANGRGTQGGIQMITVFLII